MIFNTVPLDLFRLNLGGMIPMCVRVLYRFRLPMSCSPS